MARQQFGRDVIGGEPPLAHFDGKPPRGACNFLPRTVIESDDEHQAVIALGQLFRFFKQSPDVRRQVLALADNPYVHIAFVQIGKIVTDEAAKQRQEVANFRLRPRPVFGAERKDCEHGNAEIAGGAHGLAQCLNAAAMPFDARQTARCGPPPVAVHDNGNMARHLEAAVIGERLRYLACRHGCIAQTVMISFSLAARSFSTSAIVESVAFCTSSCCRVCSSSLILWSFSSFLRRSRPSRRTWRTATRAASAYLCATFTSSRRRSSLSSGMRRRRTCPSVDGVKPRLAAEIAFSTA